MKLIELSLFLFIGIAVAKKGGRRNKGGNKGGKGSKDSIFLPKCAAHLDEEGVNLNIPPMTKKVKLEKLKGCLSSSVKMYKDDKTVCKKFYISCERKKCVSRDICGVIKNDVPCMGLDKCLEEEANKESQIRIPKWKQPISHAIAGVASDPEAMREHAKKLKYVRKTQPSVQEEKGEETTKDESSIGFGMNSAPQAQDNQYKKLFQLNMLASKLEVPANGKFLLGKQKPAPAAAVPAPAAAASAPAAAVPAAPKGGPRFRLGRPGRPNIGK